MQTGPRRKVDALSLAALRIRKLAAQALYLGMSDNITFETDNYRWFIKLKRKDRQTTATVRKTTTTKRERAVSSGVPALVQQHEEFTLTEPDQDALMKRVRAQVVRLDGPILKAD